VYGNLIALPLNGKSLEKGNSVFVNPETFEVYPYQWEFLSSFQRLTNEELDQHYNKLVGQTSNSENILSVFAQPIKQLQIIIRNKIFLNSKERNRTNCNGKKSSYRQEDNHCYDSKPR